MSARPLLQDIGAGPASLSFGRWLARVASIAAAGPKRSAHLPIEGLSEQAGELPAGELCVLVLQGEASRTSLLRALLTSTAPARRTAWVCAPGAMPRALAQELRVARARGEMLAFSWTGEAAGQIAQLGPAQLLRELALASMGPDDLLVLDALDPWLSHLHADSALESAVEEAAAALLRLAKAHRGPVLALSSAQFRGLQVLPLWASNPIRCLAAVDLEGQSPRFDLLRGNALRRAASEKEGARYFLEAAADGAWRARGREVLDAQPLLVAQDAQTTHVQRGALLDASGAPPNWRVHASLESVLAAARDALAATVVLAHESPEDVIALADAVHQLRREHPRLLKIIVRETGATLRQNGEIALLRLGANAVVGRGQGFAHLVQVVSEVREQPNAKVAHVKPELALQALAPDPIQGYLALPAFCNAVERMLERTADTALEHSLVHVPLLPHVAHLDALLACHCRRDGDVVTADAQGLVLFLFGCAPEDAMAALEALFAIPCSELARMVQIEPDGTLQRQALSRLRRAADTSPLDFSTVLRGISPAQRPAPVQAAVLPTRSAEAARCVQAHVLPLRAATA